MTTIDIKYDDRQVRDALNRLLQGSRDMSPAMRVIAGHLEEGAQQAFADKRAPDGTPWAKLKDSTKAQRKKAGYGAGPILERSGDLLASITSDYDGASAVAGTNYASAPTHQFGAKRGEYGSFTVVARTTQGKYTRVNRRTPKRNLISAQQRRSKPVQIPWGDIPARRFLGISDADRDNILDAINTHLAQQWK